MEKTNNITVKNPVNASFKCVRTASGKYSLYKIDAFGMAKRVPKIGFSTQPFEIVEYYANGAYMAVKKYSKTPNGIVPQLCLLETATGKILGDNQNITGAVIYDAPQKRFYTMDTFNKAAYESLLELLRRAGIFTMQTRDTSPNLSTPTIQITNVHSLGNVVPIVDKALIRRKRIKKSRKKRLMNKRKLSAPNKSRLAAAKRPKLRKNKPVKSAIQAKITQPYSLRPQNNMAYYTPLQSQMNLARAQKLYAKYKSLQNAPLQMQHQR